jgi:hypothetical protein
MNPAQPDACPVCGYELGFVPWVGNSPSDEICPCCGIQFGYDDAAGGNIIRRGAVYRKWRLDWIRRGCPWTSASIPQPHVWDPLRQMKAAGISSM